MLPTLVIFFRESLEASLIVGIILAYLRRIARPDAVRAVWAGVAAAMLADLALGVGLFHVVRSYDGSRFQTVLEGTTYFIATAMLTYMSFWMNRQSRGMREALEHDVQAALDRGSRLSLLGLTVLTVGREGLETVFFTLAIAFHEPVSWLAAGALLGLALGLAVTYALYRFGRRVPLTLFFNVLGVLLLVFAAALLSDGIEDYQALNWLPWLRHAVWHSGHWLAEQSLLGDLAHNFLGYAAAPSTLQLLGYGTFLLIFGARYLARPRPSARA